MNSPPPSRSPSPIFDDPPSRNSSISSASSGCETKVPLQLPRQLPHPESHLNGQPAPSKVEVDEALLGVPLPFIRAALSKLGPSLLASSNQTRPIIPVVGTLPPRIACRPPPPHLPCPTHLLALTFRDEPSHHVLLPTHGLPLALASPLLGDFSTLDAFVPTDGTFSLPAVPLCMPSSSTFFALHDYLLLGDLDHLFQTLDRQLDSHGATQLDPSPGAPRKAATLHGLWSNVVALKLEDGALWERLQREWGATVAELSL